jgi:hypothetical protein
VNPVVPAVIGLTFMCAGILGLFDSFRATDRSSLPAPIRVFGSLISPMPDSVAGIGRLGLALCALVYGGAIAVGIGVTVRLLVDPYPSLRPEELRQAAALASFAIAFGWLGYVALSYRRGLRRPLLASSPAGAGRVAVSRGLWFACDSERSVEDTSRLLQHELTRSLSRRGDRVLRRADLVLLDEGLAGELVAEVYWTKRAVGNGSPLQRLHLRFMLRLSPNGSGCQVSGRVSTRSDADWVLTRSALPGVFAAGVALALLLPPLAVLGGAACGIASTSLLVCWALLTWNRGDRAREAAWLLDNLGATLGVVVSCRESSKPLPWGRITVLWQELTCGDLRAR